MIARIAAGAVLGGIIGYERDRHGRPVGLRTHLIVAMTAATFMVVSSQFVYLQGYAEHDLAEVDGSRIAASVVSGIGFLAGGAILRTGATIQGLTTAAGLWLVSAIGLCCGGGMFIEGLVVTLMGVFALTALRRLEDKNDDIVKRRLALVLADDPHILSKVTESITALGVEVTNVEYERRLDEKRRTSVVLDVKVPARIGVAKLIERIESFSEVRRIHMQGSS
jgi:putative Mg2+ transporter-C (MgtC) family protein